MSTPEPRLQTPFYSEQQRVTIAPISTGSTVHEKVPKVDVVFSGEGNLLSQTVGQSVRTRPPTTLSSQTIQQKSTHSQTDQKQTTSFTAVNRSPVTQQRISSSSVTQTTQSIPSTQASISRGTIQSNQQPLTTSARSNQFSSTGPATTYSSRVSFGQKLSTASASTGTTTVPYSPSVPPFRSTTTTTYTPTATSYNQHTQAYNGQSHETRSFTQHDSNLSSFSSNQFQVPAKEYLPSAENTRTARTNELSFGNHGSSTKLSSSQNFVRNGNSRHDGRQQFTYPVDQVN